MNNEHWYVLLTIRSKEEEVCKYLNENEGIFAFSPKMEFYHRVSKQIQLRTLFGGYVFVVSKLSQVEVDRIFRKFPLESVFIHELKYKEDISALNEKTTFDTELSETSEEAVQKKVITKEIRSLTAKIVPIEQSITDIDIKVTNLEQNLT